MANIKGSLALDDVLKNHHHGPNFNFPSKVKATTETLITTTTEIAKSISDTIDSIFTNVNTQNETDVLTSNNSQNGTSIDINVGSKATSTGNNITDIFNIGDSGIKTLQNSTEGVKVVVNTVQSTIENVTDYVTSTASDIITSTVEEDGNMETDMHTNSHKTYHIIITVLVIILFMVGLGLFSIYMYYKKRNQAHITGHYHSQGSREIPTSSDRNVNESVVIHQQQSAC